MAHAFKIPAFKRCRQVVLRVPGQPDLHSEFWVIQGCRVRPCLKNKNGEGGCSWFYLVFYFIFFFFEMESLGLAVLLRLSADSGLRWSCPLTGNWHARHCHRAPQWLSFLQTLFSFVHQLLLIMFERFFFFFLPSPRSWRCSYVSFFLLLFFWKASPRLFI